MAVKVGMVRGTCTRCGRIHERRRPADFVFCDCHIRCPFCGRRMEEVTPDMNPRTYRREDVNDPTGFAQKSKMTMHSKYYCSACDHYDNGIPVEVRLT